MMRCMMLHFLCMIKQPHTIKQIKDYAINFERIRDDYIKRYLGGDKGLSQNDIDLLRMMRSDVQTIRMELRQDPLRLCMECK